MSLRFKTSLFVALVVAAMVLSIRAGVRRVIEREFADVEAATMRKRVDHVVAVLQTLANQFDSRFADWSQWDDTAEFVRTGDPSYIDSNVDANAVVNLGVDLLYLASADGVERLAVQRDRATETVHDIDADFRRELTPQRLLKGVAENAPSFGGLLRVGESSYVVCSRPVLWNDGTPSDPPARLVVARKIDEQWQAQLRMFTFVDVSMSPCDFEAPYELQLFDSDHVEATQTLHDVFGAPVLLARIRSDRPTLVHGRQALSSSAWAVMLCGIGALLLALLALRHAVLSPIRALLLGVSNLERGAAASIDVRTSDEFDALARAFERMSQRVLDRERELKHAHAEVARLLDNLRQGVLSFNASGAIDAHTSKRAPELLGRNSLAGAQIAEVLYDGAPETDFERAAFVDWSALIFGTSPSDWAELGPLAPSELTSHRNSGDERQLNLEFEPIYEDEALERVLVLVTDVTETHRLRAERDASQLQHDQQLADLRREVALGPHRTAQFLLDGRRRVERLREAWIEHGDRDEALRQAHTLKGDSRLFELHDIESSAGALEAELCGVTSREGSAPLTSQELEARLADVLSAIDRAEHDLVESSPICAAVLEQTPVRRSDLDRLADAVIVLADELAPTTFRELASISRQLSSRPFGEIAQPLADQTTRWASAQGELVSCVVDGRETPIPSDLASVLSSALTHLARNAVAHAFEPPAKRLEASKSAHGSFTLSARATDDGPRIEVRDDGRGVDRDALIAAARERGRDTASIDPLELLFVDGLSTRESADELAGRGVGLSAVRAELARVGYSISVESTPGAGSLFRLEPRRRAELDQ